MCDESEEIFKRLTLFPLTRRTRKRVEYIHERVDLKAEEDTAERASITRDDTHVKNL